MSGPVGSSDALEGVIGKLASAALAVPGMQGLLKKGLDKDCRDNLY